MKGIQVTAKGRPLGGTWSQWWSFRFIPWVSSFTPFNQGTHIHAIRGSANEDGARALAQLMKTIRDGWDIGLTPDGPKGPTQMAKPGVVALAQKSGASILPVCVTFDRFRILSSWDSMVIPLPFAQCVIHYAPPMNIKPDLPPLSGAQQLTQVLNDLEAWAEKGRAR